MIPDEFARAAALRWVVRAGDADFDDWDGLTAWLEQDPAHARAYDEAAAAVEDGVVAMAAQSPLTGPVANDDWSDESVPARRERRWAGAAIAAAFMGMLALGLWQLPGSERMYEAPAGSSLNVALDDGSSISLAGGTKLAVLKGERSARLIEGRALFTIRHDETAPFKLIAGDDTIVDVGTVFDVSLTPGGIDVAVGEGAVVVNPASRGLRLDAGEAVRRRGSNYLRQDVAPTSVGEWTAGRITFRDATLAEVALELTRATGIPFSAGENTREAVSGSLETAAVKADPQALEALLDIRLERRGTGWILLDRE